MRSVWRTARTSRLERHLAGDGKKCSRGKLIAGLGLHEAGGRFDDHVQLPGRRGKKLDEESGGGADC